MDSLSGYARLVAIVTRNREEDVLPLTADDIDLIDGILESLGSGKKSNRSHKEVLSVRFGLDGSSGCSQARAAKIFQVSKQAVHIQEKKALRLLRHPTRLRTFKKFLRT